MVDTDIFAVYSFWSTQTETFEEKATTEWKRVIPTSTVCLLCFCVGCSVKEHRHCFDISCNQVPFALQLNLPLIYSHCEHYMICFALIVIRCKIMIQAADTDDSNNKSKQKQRKTITGVLQAIWRREGVSGFYKGLNAQILKTVLSSALLLMIKEKIAATSWLLILALKKVLIVNRGRIKGVPNVWYAASVLCPCT